MTYSRIRTFLPVFMLGYALPAFAFSLTIENPLLNASDLPTLIEHVSAAVVKIGIPITVVAIIFGGFKFVTASATGNETRLKEARTMLMWTIVGSAVIVGGAALVYAAVNFAKTL